ncbi:hypothetical protein BB560_000545 [Smittium megazygosporum]|uniref:Phosphatidylethanolamine N-methyltransferase n=1 Tax=Smittium megazygosporum TaxID=133381 RepID=A0A2T9ZK22_9FUNG|nr:hypothetical protein BB560_000545 [Smittium megazygosporum]
MANDYKYDEVPLEFNIWLLFRQLVDLILVCDFLSYFLFALSYLGTGSNDAESWQLAIRYFGGVALVIFNIWVKSDAHRVIKDYAWYWGDFFFKVKQWLVFDGVFEMAPHPMYSIGYAGYYGASLITGSYTVFYASVFAHTLQFLFLSFVENPHIEKTYEVPPIFDEVVRINKERTETSTNDKLYFEKQPDNNDLKFRSDDKLDLNTHKTELKRNSSLPSFAQGAFISNLQNLGNKNLVLRAELVNLAHFTLFRPVDLLLLLLTIYGFIAPLLVGIYIRNLPKAFQTLLTLSIFNCVFWVLIRSIGLGIILKAQSKNQWFTKWFIKRGGTAQEAFDSWKAMYNVSCLMTFCSFILVACFSYFWKDGTVLSLRLYYSESLQFTIFRHSLGLIFIALHIWSSKSIYASLGDFGWFYGDFFIPLNYITDKKLLYTGIYRYLNDPEKVLGQSALYGLALMSGSWSVFALALTLQLLLWGFYSLVEQPHTKKLYGEQVRSDSGVTRTIKKAITENSIAKSLISNIPKKISSKNQNKDTVHSSNPFFVISKSRVESAGNIETSGHKRDKSITDVVSEQLLAPMTPIKEFFKETKDMITMTKKKISDKMIPQELRELGEPIRISWQAPVTHSRKDWVGIYKITSNFFRHVSSVSSEGKYIYIHPNEKLMLDFLKGDCFFTGKADGIKTVSTENDNYEPSNPIEVYYGSGIFSGNALPWEEGVYEMRLHHGLSHAVISTSKPFTIKASCDESEFSIESVSRCFKSVVNRCLSVTVTEKESDQEIILNNDKNESINEEIHENKDFTTTEEMAKEDQLGFQPGENNLQSGNKNDFGTNWKTSIVNPLKTLQDPIGINGMLDETTSSRLAACISSYFNIEYSPDVLKMAAKNEFTVGDVAVHIYESKRALAAFIKEQVDLLITPRESISDQHLSI